MTVRTTVDCPFCKPALESHKIQAETHVGLVLWDGMPISRGHTLVVPKQHIECFFDLPPWVQSTLWDMVAKARTELKWMKPDGFNIGINDGPESGQTVAHAHIHIIPRYKGDVPDPRGGIRWVIADKAKYW